MSLWDQHFFGLTLIPKLDLFLRDIQAIMKVYPGTSYWDAYLLPVPVRRWLIEEHIRQTEKQEVDLRQQKNNRFQHPVNIPLTPNEKKSYQSPSPRSVKK